MKNGKILVNWFFGTIAQGTQIMKNGKILVNWFSGTISQGPEMKVRY
jgi:hypothetical protein